MPPGPLVPSLSADGPVADPLAPAAAVRAAVLPAFFSAVFCDAVESTNDELARRAREGAAEGTLIVAGEQTRGRGRRGRQWLSPPGNLYCSLLLRPGCAMAEASQLSFVSALALALTVEAVLAGAGGVEARGSVRDGTVTCKWPNDVLVGGRKLAGILLDSEVAADGRCAWVVIGMGVNLRWSPGPTEGQFPATSLRAEIDGQAGNADCAEATDPHRFLERLAPMLVSELDRWRAEGFETVRGHWLDRAFALGAAITVRLHDRTLEGVFTGLDAGGGMVLACGGEGHVLTAGDVVSVRT